MANIRQDQAQLIITIDAKESAEYQKTLQNTAKGVQDIKKLTAGTDEYNKVLNEQAAISRKLANSDFSKLSGKQLADRKSQLLFYQRTLPQVTFAEAGFERELQRVNQALATNAQRTRAVSTEMATNTRAATNWRNVYAIGVGILTGAGVAIAAVTARFQKYSAVLKVALGSQQEADKSMILVKETAAQTTFTVDELTESYVKFANRGIKLTKDEMIALSDLAASQGKSFDQLTEAILDAQTGEFERLKEFGIRASKSGNEAELSFKGFNTTAKLTPEAIKAAFVEMGKMNGVAGANAEQMTTLNGRWSNFKDAIDSLLVSLGNRFASGFGKAIGLVTDLVKSFESYFAIPISQKIQEEQSELNALVQAITDTNVSQDRRNQLIGELQNKYPFFLENINAETASNDELKKRLNDINELYIKRIALQSQQERIDALLQKAGDARIKQFDIEKNRRVELNNIVRKFGLGVDLNKIDGLDKQTSAVANSLQKLFSLGAESARDGTRAINGNIQAFDAYNKIIGNTLSNRGVVNVVTKTKEEISETQSDLKQLELELGTTLGEINKLFTTTTGNTGGGGGGGGNSDAEKKKKEQAEKEAAALLKKKLELQAKERDALLAFNPLNPEFAQGVLDLRLKMLEDAAAREQLALEESYLQGKISLEQYELEKLRITSGNLATRIELLDAYGQAESDKRRELNIELLKVESDIIQERAAQIGELENAQLTDLENKFANRLITEQEYNLSRLRVQLNFYDEQLRLLEENGLIETEVYKKIQAERLKTQIDYNKQTTDNEQKTADLKKAIANEGIGIAKEIFSLGADLLSQDEKARRKHATAIKAFETASIFVNSLAEIAENYKQSAKLGPIAGPIVGTARAIFTAVRAGIAIAKVNAQQFFLGGKIKTVSGQLIQERPNINPLPGGDNVLIAAKPGEVMFNEPQQENLKRLAGSDIFRRLGIPGFADGGLIPSLPRTTPTISPQVLSRNGAPIAADNGRIDMLLDAVQQITRSIPEAISAMDLKTHVVYTDFNKVQNTVNEIKRISSY